ncbi:AAA family ATPase [Piscinibacter defluvii]|uniref:AAA family ATPase n=1 Tax=Piscinibacter defluvii TaxID=1796922 RepID=UPI000FDDE936|nr:ATP-binding protein [Piscinibacter defluvii]
MGAAPSPRAIAQAAAAAELQHWRLRTLLVLLRAAVAREGALEPLLGRHAALRDTLDAAADAGLADLTLDDAIERLDQRAQGAPAGPLSRLRDALGLDADGLGCFVAAALAADDPRLAAFVDELHGRAGRPTRATLALAFGAVAGSAALQRLRGAGALLEGEQDPGLAVPAALWELAGGLPPDAGRWQHWPREALMPLPALILPAALRARLEAPPAPATWLLRGSPGSGRRTLAGALARAAGRGLVAAVDAPALASLGAAAALLDAAPLLSFEPAPGEAIAWTPPPGLPAPCFLRLPRHGGLTFDGPAPRRIDLEPPDADERRRHWALAWPGRAVDAALVGWRLPRGRLHRAAQAVPPDTPDALAAVAEEIGALGRHALDSIARRVSAAGADEPLALGGAAGEEFEALVARCRHRDRLAGHLPAAQAAACGVRALFKGPSGTGKTLAARHLAARLARPLYRVDLAATVSKYIGETERNLERVFDAAESLDIVLLLDEGDALLAGRTGVQSSTDRYANLETNYLLQRLEAYAGVLVVTTNAADRIDPAFARRLDVTVEFALPDAATRLALWASHLGAGHAVGAEALERIARRCAIAGGQIRNAALHAALLAIDRDRALDEALLLQALEREYRKAGQQCPSLRD